MKSKSKNIEAILLPVLRKSGKRPIWNSFYHSIFRLSHNRKCQTDKRCNFIKRWWSDALIRQSLISSKFYLFLSLQLTRVEVSLSPAQKRIKLICQRSETKTSPSSMSGVSNTLSAGRMWPAKYISYIERPALLSKTVKIYFLNTFFMLNLRNFCNNLLFLV